MIHSRVITLVTSLTLLLRIAAVGAQAQQLAKVPRIRVLDASPGFEDALQDGLRRFGYVEGKTITIEWRRAHASAERFPELAAELVRLRVDVIVAANNPTV